MEKAEQWIRVKELFNAALERDADQREPFLREACGQDESLRAEVESLLAAHFEASALSEGPFFSADFDAPAPESIGPYKLIRKLGEGGMGQVWLAEQVSPLHREVALKLLRAGIFDSGLLKRFQAERQSLAMMDHPAIAKVFDAGSTPSGQPYLVMEYVPGLPITDYCDAKKLSIGERLELFIRTCEGVQHAHQKAIIHRDLKPANILVVEVDGKPSPRIIDFGLAKAATPLLDEKTALLTQAGSFLGTPGYMSPEQTGSSGQDIDTRTDVYSLGVVLYVLLTGFLPFETKKKSMQEMLHQIREEDPPRPSARISRAKDFSAFNAAARGLEPAQLVSTLQGDLDWIVMKALEKDRNRRYGTPSELAADVGHYLRHEPVLARPAGTAYRLQKYVRRHRIGVALTAFMVLLLAGFTAVSIWQSVRATRQRDRADAETAVAKAVNQFLQDDLLSQASSDSQGGAETKPDPDVKVRTLLDRASEKVGKRFANQPLAESAVRRTIGDTYHGLGLFAEAEQHVRRSYELSRDHRGVDDLETIEILEDLSGIVSDQGRRPEALNMAKTVYEVKARKLGPEDPATAVAMQNLGVFYLFERQYAQAEPLFKKALEIQTRSFGYNNIATLNTSDSLAALYLTQSKYSEADAFFTRGLESYRRLYGPEHPFTQREMYGLGRVLFGEGKYPEAETLIAQVLAGNQRLKGARHPDTLYTASLLGQIYVEEGKFTQATSLLEKTAQDFRETLGPGHPGTLGEELALGTAYDSHGNLPRAEQIWQDALQGYRRLSDVAGVAGAANASELLGQNLTKQRKYAQAEPLLRQALAHREKTDPDNWQRFRAQAFLGSALAGQTKYDEAEKLLLSGYQGMSQRAAQMPAREKKWILLSGEHLVDLYSQWSKPEQAAQWRAKLQGEGRPAAQVP